MRLFEPRLNAFLVEYVFTKELVDAVSLLGGFEADRAHVILAFLHLPLVSEQLLLFKFVWREAFVPLDLLFGILKQTIDLIQVVDHTVGLLLELLYLVQHLI